jgi:phosphatidylglycerophosphate synthase
VFAGTALLVSGFFDILDGAVARQTGRVTLFGGFLDSVLDRYADLAVTLGIFIYFSGRACSQAHAHVCRGWAPRSFHISGSG